MSDTSQGPGWWLASDGKWYPPELWTGPPQTGPTQTATTGSGIPEPAQTNEPAEPGQAAQPGQSDTTQEQPGGGIPPYPGAGTAYGGAPESYPGQAGQSQYPYSSSSYGGPSPSVKNKRSAAAYSSFGLRISQRFKRELNTRRKDFALGIWDSAFG